MDERREPWTEEWTASDFFAFVEQRDAAVLGATLLVLDIVRATEIEPLLGGEDGARAELGSLPTAQVTLEVPPSAQPDFSGYEEGSWHRVRLGPDEAYPATLYRSPSGTEFAPTMLSVAPQLEKATAAALLALVSLDDARDATQFELDDVVRVHQGAHVAVINVGQGNCNAICDLHGIPTLYFDLGAGCLWNAQTRPSRLEFCFTEARSVVLSHWDFDHWYGGFLSREQVRTRPVWLAPRQAIGVRTRKFAVSLIRDKRLIIWPANQHRVRNGTLELVKCTGASKNDSGIALATRVERGVVLCPGDAAFDHLPVPRVVGRRPIVGLVATHHGSAHVGAPLPRPKRRGARIAFSFGASNTYRHPDSAARLLYSSEGWTRQLETPAGSIALGGRCMPTPCGGGMCSIGTTQA